MENFEPDYNNLISYATKVIIKQRLRISAEDLVNDCYLFFVDTKTEYSYKKATGFIIGKCYKEQTHEQTIMKADYRGYSYSYTSKKCNRCKEDKPMSAFYFTYRKGMPQTSTRCKACICEVQLEVQRIRMAKRRAEGKCKPKLKDTSVLPYAEKMRQFIIAKNIIDKCRPV